MRILFFAFFQPFFSIELIYFSGAVSFCRRVTLSNPAGHDPKRATKGKGTSQKPIFVPFFKVSLGGNFGPEEKYLAPLPKFLPNTLPAPSPPRPTQETPPPLGFSIKKFPPPPPSQCLGLPFPLPRAEKKIRNIRNVHRVHHEREP